MWNINLFATYRDNSLKILLAFIGPLHIFNTRRPSLPLLGISVKIFPPCLQWRVISLACIDYYSTSACALSKCHSQI